MILTFITLLTITGTAMAQSNALSVADISLPQNSEATLTVSFQFDAANTYTGYSFNIELPEELEFVMEEGTDVACTKGACHDASHSVTANLSEGLVKVAGLSLSSKPLTGTSGTLLTFAIKPASPTLTIGQTYTGKIKDILLVPVEGTKKSLPESTFTITIAEPTDTRTILDETSTVAPEAASSVNVRVKRAIKAGSWSTICLPFAMTAEQMVEAFGQGVEVKDFTSWSSVEDEVTGDIVSIKIGFTPVVAMEANHPYLIKVTNAITAEEGFTVDGVDIDPDDEPTKQVGTKKAERGYFIGTYVANTIVPEDDLFISNDKFYYSKGKTKMKAFRGYFELADVITDIENASTRITLSDDETTGITNLNGKMSNDSSDYYDLQGRKVVAVRKGLYIKNNKKVVIK